MGIFAPLMVALVLAHVPPVATRTAECTNPQQPATFDKATAMLAVFCVYDREHEGILLPIGVTPGSLHAQAPGVTTIGAAIPGFTSWDIAVGITAPALLATVARPAGSADGPDQ